MACDIRDSQPSNYVDFADSKEVDVSTLTSFTGCGVDRPDKLSGSDFCVKILDASPYYFTLKLLTRFNVWKL
jgi:hypothetical protein